MGETDAKCEVQPYTQAEVTLMPDEETRGECARKDLLESKSSIINYMLRKHASVLIIIRLWCCCRRRRNHICAFWGEAPALPAQPRRTGTLSAPRTVTATSAT